MANDGAKRVLTAIAIGAMREKCDVDFDALAMETEDAQSNKNLLL